MRAVVQRVRRARVTVGENDTHDTTGEIGLGLLVLLGVGVGDERADADYLLEKIVGLRIFEDAAGKMNLPVTEVAGALLVVSQFTLYGDVRRGLRPSFDGAMDPAEAERACDAFVLEARRVLPVQTGRFRAHMNVTSHNDGPVTLIIDSERQRD